MMRVRIRRNTLTIQTEEKKAEEATPNVERRTPLSAFSPTGRALRNTPNAHDSDAGERRQLDWSGIVGLDLADIERRAMADALSRESLRLTPREIFQRMQEMSTTPGVMETIRSIRPMLPPPRFHVDRYYTNRDYRYGHREALERLLAEVVRGDSNAANTETAEGARGTGTGGETDQAGS